MHPDSIIYILLFASKTCAYPISDNTLIHARHGHASDHATVNVDSARRSNTDSPLDLASFLASFGDEPRISIRSHDDKDSHKGNNKDDKRDPNEEILATYNFAQFPDSRPRGRHHKRAETTTVAVDDIGQLGNTADASTTNPNVFAAQED